jgi:DNA-3-methyladenine glycosylase I
MPTRCGWADAGPLEIAYHDTEWGVPSRDDRHLFEMLILEGAQAGLSWSTILRKREGYRKAFAAFDPVKVARFDGRRRAALMRDPGIVRNRHKIEAAVTNARQVLAVQEEFGSLADYLWRFVDGEPIRNAWTAMGKVPAETAESRAMSRALVQRGFRFVGPTICYAFMQATGMVNDHITTCFRYSRRRSQRS